MDLIHPTQGQAMLFGEEVQSNQSILSKVGSLVEDPGFYNFMSGRDNLLTLVHTCGSKHSDRVDQLLDQVRLTESAAQRVAGYSKGMHQRLGLAAALLNDPELIILDDPTNGLDQILIGKGRPNELDRRIDLQIIHNPSRPTS